MTGLLNPFGAPKPFPILIPSRFVPPKRVSSCRGALRKLAGRVLPLGLPKPIPLLLPSIFFPKNGFLVVMALWKLADRVTHLGPQNRSLYYFQVVLSPKRVSSCKGVNHTSSEYHYFICQSFLFLIPRPWHCTLILLKNSGLGGV